MFTIRSIAYGHLEQFFARGAFQNSKIGLAYSNQMATARELSNVGTLNLSISK
jgi:hypothetical protein